ncbi:hypothetical protein BASH2_01644 [Bacillus anthracis]|nr:hypothetical protein BASH2_01644 [Bacillus anthracis]
MQIMNHFCKLGNNSIFPLCSFGVRVYRKVAIDKKVMM